MILPQNYSHYSVLKSSLRPAEIPKVAQALHCATAAITDLNSMAGIVQFYKECKKQNIKPALGLTAQFMNGSTICLIALNKDGYRNLLGILSEINSKENYFKHAQISLEILKKYDCSNIACLTGHYGSSIHRAVCEYIDTEEISADWESNIAGHLSLLLPRFDKNNFYLQIEPHYRTDIVEIYNKISNKYNIQKITHNQICSGLGKDGQKLYDIMRATREKRTLKGLLDEPNIIRPINISSSDVNSKLEESIEEYDILGPQILPSFDCPDGMNSMEYLRFLCRKEYLDKIDKSKKSEYDARILEELRIFEKAGLADYFLILQDIVKWSENQGAFVNYGRGSACGCLASYLLGITKIDPIKHGLLFSRFFNAGRIGSMPDIDVDFPKKIRDKVIRYTLNKYSKEYAGQIVTYQTFMGRAALKAVFRAENELGFGEMNEITKNIEDKAKIADELQEMKDAGKEPSVLLWALENRARKLQDYVELHEDGSLSGELAPQFELAIKLEGVKSAQSKHAAGVVISNEPIKNKCPILFDQSSKQPIIGVEYEDAESLGMTKLDILGLRTLDALTDINKFD